MNEPTETTNPDQTNRESETPELCSHCLFPFHPGHQKRYFGTHVAHDEHTCIALFRDALTKSERRLARAVEERDDAERRSAELEKELKESQEYARNGHRRAAEFQTINGHKNTEIDSLKERLRRASITIQEQNAAIDAARSERP